MALALRLGCRFIQRESRHLCVLNNLMQQTKNRFLFQSRTVCQRSLSKHSTRGCDYVAQSRFRVCQSQYTALFGISNIRPSNLIVIRCMAVKRPEKNAYQEKKKYTLYYIWSVLIFMLGMCFAAVPLYRIFCQATGQGGKAVRGHDVDKIETMTKNERVIKVYFQADKNASMRWNFSPQQQYMEVALGETALAFYTAENPTDEPIVGVSTYSVVPYEAGLYFNKVQCFCFEEQLLKPHEKVDLPVFFYIDPEFDNDPSLVLEQSIVLSYTFFQAKPGLHLPLPGFQSTKLAQTQ